VETASDFLSRKKEERAGFARQERSDLEVRALKTFVLSAVKWKIGKRDEPARLTALRRLRELGIDLEASI